jgi:hypothetical protein
VMIINEFKTMIQKSTILHPLVKHLQPWFIDALINMSRFNKTTIISNDRIMFL